MITDFAELQRAELRLAVRADRVLVEHAGLLRELVALLGEAIDEEELARLLVERDWDRNGGPERSRAAIRAVERRHQVAAARAKRELRRSPENVRELVDTLLREHPTWSKQRAFAVLAESSRVTLGRIENLYYASRS